MSGSQSVLTNGAKTNGVHKKGSLDIPDDIKNALVALNKMLKGDEYLKDFHGDPMLLEVQHREPGFFPAVKRLFNDVATIAGQAKTYQIIAQLLYTFKLDVKKAASIVASLNEYGPTRTWYIGREVDKKWSAMLHPPLSYLGDAFQYRTVDGSFNSVLHPHLGQAGAPYAKTVPAKARLLGAQPDPGDIFDRLMAREKDRPRVSQSGLSVLLVYHATIIIHDIFRTNIADKNISDSSSYLDLSPLYGYNETTQKQVRKGHLGLLWPDTFAENRLLRQPPGVCTMLVMYNRYHNYCARQLLRINENGRFQVPEKYGGKNKRDTLRRYQEYEVEIKGFSDRYRWENRDALKGLAESDIAKELKVKKNLKLIQYQIADTEAYEEELENPKYSEDERNAWESWKEQNLIRGTNEKGEDITWVNIRFYGPVVKKFRAEADAAWKKLDDDLFNTARLITCGIYINISIHDYLRALMGFHQWNSTFTLDPRVEVDKMNGKEGLARGIGNQVTVEFNMLYRFHCAISSDDERWLNRSIQENYGPALIKLKEAKDRDGNLITDVKDIYKWDPTTLTSSQFNRVSAAIEQYKAKSVRVTVKAQHAEMAQKKAEKDAELKSKGLDPELDDDSDGENEEPHPFEPRVQTITGLRNQKLERDKITNRFNDQDLIDILNKKMDDPICQFGPKNIPRSLKAVEVAGILQARKWEVGTLNDFREFFGLSRYKSFSEISRDGNVQQALSDLYENVDKVEFYPGVFCEGGDENNALNCDPGPQNSNSTLWAAIFSDAITLVRSDRFYTVDWNTNSLTSWGMKEVTADGEVLKSSVFHRLIQRAFPEWYGGTNLHFFHPFYTTETNMKYAQAQGYGPAFGLPNFDLSKDQDVTKALLEATQDSMPTKPNQAYVLTPGLTRDKMPGKVTIIVKDYDSARAILQDNSDVFINPAWLDKHATPDIIRKALAVKITPQNTKKARGSKNANSLTLETGIFHTHQEQICKYFRQITLDIISREKNLFEEQGEVSGSNTYQIDAVRDLAIPVVTRYFADFLGFGHLLGSAKDKIKTGKFSENELYAHITNVQTYLSYNTDETKKWKRREAFKTSLSVLLKLTKEGHIGKLTSWWPWRRPSGKDDDEFMSRIGYDVAKQLLERTELGKTTDIAAAVLLLMAIDSTYNSVLIFTTTLAFLFDETNKSNAFKYLPEEERQIQHELYEKIHNEHHERKKESEASELPEQYKEHLKALNAEERSHLKPRDGLITWEQVQEIVLTAGEEKDKDHALMHIVLEAQRLKVKLPVVRKVVPKDPYAPVKIKGRDFEFRANDTIIIDVHSAESEYREYCNDEVCVEALETHCDDFEKCFKNVDPHVHDDVAENTNHRTLKNYLVFAGAFSENALMMDARYICIVGLGAMFRVLGQMQYLRQGHDSQGRLKIINNSPSWHNLDYYMAPKTVRMKVQAIKEEEEKRNEANKGVKGFVPESFITKPPSSTFLTPEWDETIPFPNTFKVRFDGFGEGVWTYGDNSEQAHGIMTLYTPQGASHTGGTWALTKCPCGGSSCLCEPKAQGSGAHVLEEHVVRLGAGGCGAMGG